MNSAIVFCDRDEVASVLAVGLSDIGARLVGRVRESGANLGELGFEAKDLLHAF